MMNFNYFVKIFIILFIITSGELLFSRSYRNVHGNYTIDDIQKNLLFSIDLDQNIYELNQKVPIKFKIKNIGFKTFRFYLDQNFGNTFYLEILNQEGEEIQNNLIIENIENYKINDIQENKIEDLWGNPIKEIILHPNEELVKTYFIYRLPVGKYRMIGYFIPYSYDNQYKNNLRFLSKNKLNLEIVSEKTIFQYNESVDTIKDSIPSPEETVYLFLMAEYYKNWENYFKYLELKEFIHSYDIFEKEYKNASIREKQLILNDFKNYLMKQNIEPIIEFKITKVIYTEWDKANVYAEVLRGSHNYRVRYLYDYSLYKKDVWKIHSVVVSIIKAGR